MPIPVRNFLYALGATVVWFFIMRPFTPPNIIAFELAGSVDSAQAIIANWTPEQISNVKTGIYLDFVFILTYCSAFMYASRAAAAFSGIEFLTKTARQSTWIIWVAGMCDAIENISLLRTLNEVTERSVSIVFYTATVKFSILLVTLVFVLICVTIGLFRKIKS
ncbi:MAG TPA: hypothetical protein PK325_11385 [Cyclobacteriaceae bacterium]|nr:hypothetical protein [Cyclobacteriaceae bacterium]HMV08577.1 hypothetical protein [Cyclobacteriaceae bacterium]HMV91118.1 hypothetical protein [Cyclobacteriaceae bacterium]HMX00214.1 hypothetical protein [Cyclobacteriaceae bacterium]HMX49787.1 hypothetical protein [Cyclobacteriaceae bacterium]